ncbi:MAG: hypothetical protein ACKV2U_26460 [Bryobacteraceae bacterium]
MAETAYYTAEVVVTNLDIVAPSNSANGRMLDCKSFTLTEGHALDLSKESARFKVSVEQQDWILAKRYPGSESYAIGPDDHSGVQAISRDIEEMLFLLRLFDTGEVAFSSVVITKPDGTSLLQLPHRIVNGSALFRDPLTQLTDEELNEFDAFSNHMKASRSWNSDWYQTAKRFFLYGTSKDFDPQRLEVDRVVDYATVLEAILVPESDLLGKRVRERCAALLTSYNPDDIKALLKEFYDIRSKIVHGEPLSKDLLKWLSTHHENIEAVVRSVLIEAVEVLPADRQQWKAAVKKLFEPTDKDREQSILQDLMRLSDLKVLVFLATKIVKRAQTLVTHQ